MVAENTLPVGLRASRHAPSTPIRTAPSFPSAAPSPLGRTNGTTATKDLVPSPVMAHVNPDAQLAVMQNELLRDEVENQVKIFNKTVSSAVINTRHLIELLADYFKQNSKASKAELKVVEDLSQELQQLVDSGKATASLVPQFLEKQEANMKLYHNSVMNEMMRETQDELNLQHKKVNIQHSLILEHQETFQDYKQQTESKLKQLAELQERVSRLTLDKGLLRTELESYRDQLEKANAEQAGNIPLVEDLKKELQTALEVKRELKEENETLRQTVIELKSNKADQDASALKEMTEALSQASEEKMTLKKANEKLRAGEAVLRKEMEQLKNEHTALKKKYDDQSAEFSKMFTESSCHASNMAKLTAELEETKKSNLNQSKTNTDLTLAIEKLANLEKEKASLLKTNQDQKKQIDSLERDAVQSEKLSTAFEQEAKAKMQQLEDRAVELELENSDLMKQITSLQKKTSIVSVGQANGNSGNGNSALVEALKAQVQESEIERKQLSESLEQWQLLAKTTYAEYKEMLPKCEEADKLRRDCAAKEEEINKLRHSLQSAKSGKPGSDATSATVQYWKTKYEMLLDSLQNVS